MKNVDWNIYAKHYDNLNHLIGYQELILQLIDNSKRYVPDTKTIFDIGCGTGTLLIELAKLYPEASLQGIDSSKEMLKVAKDKIKKNDLKNVEVNYFDITKLSEYLPEQKYDLIVMNNVIYTINDKSKLLDTLKKYLNDNGIIIFSDPVPVKDYKYSAILKRQLKSISAILKTIALIPSLLYILKINKLIDKSYKRLNATEYNTLINKNGYTILKSERSYAGQANLFVIKKVDGRNSVDSNS